MTARRFTILGPPGCGKTTEAKRQIEVAAEKYGAARLAVASLTRAAIAEIVGRDIQVPTEQARTLHGLAYRALGPGIQIAAEPAILKDWNEYCASHGRPELEVPLTKGDYDDPYDDDVRMPEWYETCAFYRARLMDMATLDSGTQTAYALWREWKRDRYLYDFQDLIEQAYEQRTTPPGDPIVLFQDEAQDADRSMMRLIDMWAERMEYVVQVGDPDQCLYEWRGSEPNLIRAAPDYEKTLAQSYRVPAAVHEAAVRWIERTPGRLPVEYYPRDDPGELMHEPGTSTKDPRGIVDIIEEHAGEGTIMYLGATKYAVNPIVAELRRRGLPYHNPYRRHNGAWNPLAPRRGTSTAQRLAAFVTPNSRLRRDVGRPWTGSDLAKWLPMVRTAGVIRRGGLAVLQAVPEDAGFPVVMRAIEDAVEPDALVPLLRADPAWLAEHCLSRFESALEYPTTVLEEHGARALGEEPRIIVGTIHSVKGGEANTVVLAPDLTPKGMEAWQDERGEGAVRRTFYVGMTRARHRLVLIGNRSHIGDHVDWDA